MHELYEQLCRYTESDWRRTVDTLAGEIHPIDLNATRIWFAFYPLKLYLALDAAEDPAALARKLGLMGQWRLADQIDASHRFFFAHRYWPQVKSAVQHASLPLPADLAALTSAIADAAARTARVDREFLLGISAAALDDAATVRARRRSAAPGTIHLSDRARAESPHQVLKRRAHDDWQGLLRIHARAEEALDGDVRREPVRDATFTVIDGQEIATAAQTDKRDYRSRDIRCTPGEGPIPVECRAASCGTCWVGVLGGAEKLSPVVPSATRRAG